MNAAPCSPRRDAADGVLAAQRVEDVHRLLARHGEDVLAPLGREAFDEEAAADRAGGLTISASLQSAIGDLRSRAVGRVVGRIATRGRCLRQRRRSSVMLSRD